MGPDDIAKSNDLITAVLALPRSSRWQTSIIVPTLRADAKATNAIGVSRLAYLHLCTLPDSDGLVRLEYGLVDVRPAPSGAGGQQCIDLHRGLCQARFDVSHAEVLTVWRMAVAHAESMLDEVTT